MGRTQVLTTALLGVWLGWTVAMWFAATRSFRTVDRLLKVPHPQFGQAIQPLGPDQARLLLRHLASEINRAYFGAYGWAQVLLGAVMLVLLWRQAPRDTIGIALAAVMLFLAIILTLVIQPMIVSLGRSLDFAARNPAPPQMPRFWMLHGAFTGLDGVKLLAGLGLLARLIFR
jgi:Domain of unknown function (DUF4149)